MVDDASPRYSIVEIQTLNPYIVALIATRKPSQVQVGDGFACIFWDEDSERPDGP